MIALNTMPALGFPPQGAIGVTTPALLRERGIRLRGAQAGDIPFLRRLYASLRKDELAPLPWSQTAKQAFLDNQFTLQHKHYVNHYRDADFLLIEQGDAPIGRYYVQRSPYDFLIIDISLERRSHGQGIASALIEQTQQQASECGTGVQLHVQYDNTGARRLYERLGFIVVADEGAHQRLRWAPDAN
ncbi:MAG TPA: GNAT family N-acetyltransferase [Lysobacter sp.]|nr:GNAT family N-acetyltransferase [Lysobacter sp.]